MELDHRKGLVDLGMAEVVEAAAPQDRAQARRPAVKRGGAKVNPHR